MLVRDKTMSVKILLHDESLEKFVQAVGLSKDKKELLLSKIPELDLEERKELFKTLVEIYRLDIEEKEAIERIKKYWKD